MAALVFNRVSKSYGRNAAVDEVQIEIGSGEIFSLLGPSGCGKTTLLRMAAGFLQPDSGSILLDGADITTLPPEKRPVNTVFQSYALFPHMTAWENIAFGPRMAGAGSAEVRQRVSDMLDLIQLHEHAQKLPSQLSGGQRQRVAIARALINRPRVLLLDEPLAALDLKLRHHMLGELRRIHREVGCTFVFVTHDQSEAIALSDRVAVMNEGRLQQTGSPAVIYSEPANTFVASFIGQTNLMNAIVSPPGIRLLGRSFEGVTLPGGTQPGDPVRVSIRPESWKLVAHGGISGRVMEHVFMGAHSLLHVMVDDSRITVQVPSDLTGDLPKTPGTTVNLHFNPADAKVLTDVR